MINLTRTVNLALSLDFVGDSMLNMVREPRVAGIMHCLSIEDFLSQLETEPVRVWTDGACSGNPGPGGWGVVLQQGERVTEMSGGEPQTTNNRMELMAVIEALRALPPSIKIILTTDSQYVQKGMTQWLETWKKNHWQTSAKKPVKNQELWEQLDVEAEQRFLTWEWVKGHAGHPQNERADLLAQTAVAKVVMETML